jgi:hypothetical protein
VPESIATHPIGGPLAAVEHATEPLGFVLRDPVLGDAR